MNWSVDSITDEGIRSRFVDVPSILESGVSQYWSLEGSDIMDFGCGEGVAALGLALQYAPRRVVGVNIMPRPAGRP